MRDRRKERGGSVIEFGLILTFLVPLLIGTGVMGINMVREQQTIQLAREAGYLYARGFDFSLPGNQTILANIGSPPRTQHHRGARQCGNHIHRLDLRG